MNAERNHLEEKLKLMEFCIDSIQDAVYWLALDGRFWNVNAAACGMLGYSRDELLSLSVHDIDSYYTHEEWQSDVEELRLTGTLKLKRFHTAKDGRIIPVEITSNYFTYNDSKYICCIVRDITERKQAEEALLLSRLCIDKAGIGIYHTDENGTIFSVNDYACASLGYSKEELCVLSVFDIDPAITKEKMSEIKKMLETTGSATYETIHRRKDGTTFPVEITANLLEFQGKSFGISFVKDISERKQAEEALLKSRQMLMSVLDNFPGVVFWKDRNSVYMGCNRNFSQAAGLPEPSEIVGKNDHELPWKNDAEWYLTDDRQVMESGVPKLNIIETLLHADGRVAWFETSKVPLFDAEGKVFAVLGASNDITERIKAEEALRMSQFIIDKASFGILRGQADAKILYANEYAARMLGYTQDELCSMSFFDIDQSLTQTYWQEHRKEVTTTGSSTFESVHRRKDGTTYPVEVMVNYQTFQSQEFSCSFFRDITERKRAEEELRKAYDEMESSVSERTDQLTSLTAELSLAEERERRRIATELHDHVGQTLIFSKIKLDSLSRLLPSESFGKQIGEISKYLDQSIQDIRSLTFQLSPPLLYEVGFEAAVEWLGEEFEEKYGLQVEFQDDGKKKPLAEEASVALYQMVRELLLNVAKHAKAKRVRISVGKVSGKIKISIADDGSGFDSLKGMRRKNKKSGFGLFNIRQRIEYLGGEFLIESETGQGTRATLLLPLKKKVMNRKIP